MSGHQTLQREARRSHDGMDQMKKCCSPIYPSADMKSPSPGNGPPNAEEEKSVEANKPTEQTQSEMEKDSGYYDSSSDSLSSEETPPGSAATSVIVTATTPTTSEESQSQSAYAPVYILQNVVLKQPHVLLLLQPPLKRHRKRASPPSYLPILRSYPKIAPRISPQSPAPDPPKDSAPVPSASSKVCKQPAPQLLEVSLRSLALLRRTRETQRSICELKAHTILYERALQGEEGGWERLRKAMEMSGGYRKIPPAISIERREADGTLQDTAEESTTTETTGDATPAAEEPETQTEENVTSPEKPMTSEVAVPPPDNDTGEAV